MPMLRLSFDLVKGHPKGQGHTLEWQQQSLVILTTLYKITLCKSLAMPRSQPTLVFFPHADCKMATQKIHEVYLFSSKQTTLRAQEQRHLLMLIITKFLKIFFFRTVLEHHVKGGYSCNTYTPHSPWLCKHFTRLIFEVTKYNTGFFQHLGPYSRNI